MTSLHIPVIDMTGFIHGDAAARRQVARRFGEAFERTGFCTIVNHGVDDALVTSVYDSAKAFFQFARDQKMAWASPDLKQRRGYLPMGVESVAPHCMVKPRPICVKRWCSWRCKANATAPAPEISGRRNRPA